MRRTTFLFIMVFTCFVYIITAQGATVDSKTVNANSVNRNGRLLVYGRGLFEELGATVGWIADEKKITIAKNNITIEMAMGDTAVQIVSGGSSRRIESDVPAELLNGKAYVPLRIISESIGASVHWNVDEKTASITYDENMTVIADTKSFDMVLRNKVINFDIPANQISGLYGECDALYQTAYSYEWQAYNKDLSKFGLIGVRDGKAVAFYSNSKNTSIIGITPGMSAARLNAHLGITLPESEVNVLKNKIGQLTVYRNAFDNYSVLAVLAQKDGYTDVTDFSGDMLHQSAENQLYDIINAERANRGLSPLIKDDAIADIARGHSKFMAYNGDLTHVANGTSPFDRLNEKGITDYSMASESIGRDSTDGIEMFAEWMNDKIDRSSIISKNYTHAGIGAMGDQVHKMYFTAEFVER